MLGTATMPKKSRAERLETLPDVLTSSDVRIFLGIMSARTLRLMIARGQFPPPSKFNARLHRWSKEDVVAWYKANRSWRSPEQRYGPEIEDDKA